MTERVLLWICRKRLETQLPHKTRGGDIIKQYPRIISHNIRKARTMQYETISDFELIEAYKKAVYRSYYYMAAERNYSQEKEERDENTRALDAIDKELKKRHLTPDFT